ncbi:MAG TPA: ABC transporter permease [Aggregatilineaceae bacterium]|nr:ABC transporter permease [Aggregatilineaceae bacterium]
MAVQETSLKKPSLTLRIQRLLLTQEGVLLIITLIASLIVSTQTDKFLTTENLLNQGRLMTEIGLLALPMTFIIITGGIDLSAGSIVGLSAIVLGYSWFNKGYSLEASIFIALAVSSLAGLINGLFIVRVRVPPLIMTLATLTFYRGLAEGIAQSRSVRGYPAWFYELGQEETWGIPNQLFILVIAIVITAIILSRTTFGRSLYAIGNNEKAARFSGIPVSRNILLIYTFSGFMAGLAGYIFVSRVSTTRSDMGTGWELDAIAAVVLGGTSIFGGTGSIVGTVIGLILIQLLKNGLALTGVTGDATIVVIGSVLILSVLINTIIQRRTVGV